MAVKIRTRRIMEKAMRENEKGGTKSPDREEIRRKRRERRKKKKLEGYKPPISMGCPIVGQKLIEEHRAARAALAPVN
jgi:hypothetical protein